MSKRITTQELHSEIEQIKNNHLAHMAEDIDELKDAVKDNRDFFIGRLDRIENRIFWILGMVLTTLVSLVATIISSNM
jgi:hypothetical protein